MIRERQHHTAVSCAYWDKVKSFFVDLLGFKVLGEMEKRDEAQLATVTGLPGAACRWAMLELHGYHIELFKWLTPEGAGAWSQRATSPSPRCNPCAAAGQSPSTAAAPRA